MVLVLLSPAGPDRDRKFWHLLHWKHGEVWAGKDLKVLAFLAVLDEVLQQIGTMEAHTKCSSAFILLKPAFEG